MIYYLVKAAHAYTIDSYLRRQGKNLNRRIRRLAYEDLFRMKKVPHGIYIFTDIERLNLSEVEHCTHIWRELDQSTPPISAFNHPTRSMKRYELLRELFERGINRFNVYRLTEFRRPKRFPVFIRDENEHGLIYSKLLNSPQRLDAEIERILESGQTRENKIIVEYLQTSDTTGIFRKYASFMVGGKIIPRHLFFSDQWDVRYNSNNCLDAARLAEEKHYVEQNPHEDFLNEIFRMARISYGRIDYSVLDGTPQIWEINTNPCLFPLDTGMEIAARKDLAALFASRMER